MEVIHNYFCLYNVVNQLKIANIWGNSKTEDLFLVNKVHRMFCHYLLSVYRQSDIFIIKSQKILEDVSKIIGKNSQCALWHVF